MNISKLYKVIIDRKYSNKKDSYVRSLFDEGIDRMAQKVGEEATEVVIASKNESEQRFIEETADLWFHSLVLLAARNIEPSQIFDELAKRHK